MKKLILFLLVAFSLAANGQLSTISSLRDKGSTPAVPFFKLSGVGTYMKNGSSFPVKFNYQALIDSARSGLTTGKKDAADSVNNSGFSSVFARNKAKDSAVSLLATDFTSTIATLQAYTGSFLRVLVTDSLRGGIFYYSATNLAADNGVIFAATGKGTGVWIRSFNKSYGVYAAWWGTSPDSTSNTNNTKINAALTYCGTNKIKKLWLTGLISLDAGTGALFSLPAIDGFEVSGEGMNRTKLIYPNSAVNAATQIFATTANNQWIHDIVIQNLAQSGSNDWQGIALSDGTFYPRVSRVEIFGVYGNGTAGGAGISAFMAWNTPQYTTTLGSTFASGSQVATPVSMTGIHVGSQLHIVTNAEDVVVTAITQTTFTATYVNSHTSTDVVQQYSQGFQGALLEDVTVRDSWKASGIVLNSRGNSGIRLRLENLGSTTTQHGLYIQAGGNFILNPWINGISGYGIHAHKAVASIDGSGDQYIGGTIGNCRQAAIIIDGTTNGASNTQLPNGASLNRYTLIEGITIRNSLGFLPSSAIPALDIQTPARLVGLVLEDVYTTANEAIIFSASAAGSVMTNCRMITTNAIPAGGVMKAIKVNVANTEISNNIINFGQSQINQDKCTWSNNKITDGKLILDGNNLIISNNSIDNASVDAFGFINTHNNIVIEGTRFTSSGSAILGNFDFTNLTFVTFRNNNFPGTSNYLRYSNPGLTITIKDNYGSISQGGQATVDQLPSVGTLAKGPFGASAGISAGSVLKFSAGVLVRTLTTDTSFAGIATSDLPSGASSCFYGGAYPGTIVKALTTGAWSLDDYAILSTTVAGTFKDQGATTPPAQVAYGMFLDAGGGSGIATILILSMGNTNIVDLNATQTLANKTLATPNITTGFKIGGAAGTGNFIVGNGTNFVSSTPTIPNTTGTVGQYVQSDGTNMVYNSGVGQDAIVTNSGAINTTETVITKTAALAANRLLAGTTIRVTLIGTCTSTAANTSTFSVRIGTNGTTADGLMEQAVTAVAATSGTNIPFKVVFEFTVRTVGASATSQGMLSLIQTGITGISAQTTQVVLPTFTNFNTTTASNIISVSYLSAATTTTTTFNNAFIEILYK